MKWQKLSDSEDLISYEKKGRDFNTRIEARLENGRWRVFKTYNDGKKTKLVSECSVPEDRDVRDVIDDLKSQKDLSNDELKNMQKKLSREISIELTRDYKDYDVEKWFFRVNKDEHDNFIVIRYSDTIKIDIVMSNDYSIIEKKVVAKLYSNLGLEDNFEDLVQNIYYYVSKSGIKKKSRKMLLGKIEMGFEMPPE